MNPNHDLHIESTNRFPSVFSTMATVDATRGIAFDALFRMWVHPAEPGAISVDYLLIEDFPVCKEDMLELPWERSNEKHIQR